MNPNQDPQHQAWRSLVQKAAAPTVPTDFAARMQGLADAADAASRLDTWLLRGLFAVLILAGLGFSVPVLAEQWQAWAAAAPGLFGWLAWAGAGAATAWLFDAGLSATRSAPTAS